MTKLLVFSEQNQVAFELLSKARELGEVSAAVLGPNAPATAQEYIAYGAQKVYVNEDARLSEFDAEGFADALMQIADARGMQIIFLGSTKRGKETAGRLAQKLGCGAVTSAIGLSQQGSQIAVQRYALGGNTVATEIVSTERQVIAVIPKTFEATRHPVSGEVEAVALKLRAPRVRIVGRKPKAAGAVDIESAEVLVAVGKGLEKQDDLALIEVLAKVLHGEVGCTRTLSLDYHWLGEERMIGISGKRCKPRLMVSLGISGQIQHTVGILGSKWIVAINKDKGAPIFKVADYGIVGDLYQVVPKLIEKFGQAQH